MQQSFFDFSGAINEEAEQADKWKERRPIRVIIGNPPYLASSTNEYDISAYKFETDGITALKEKNSKWLNDDYVKFIRFSEKHIEKDGKGVLAFISNNGYLDNPTFRGMRASLLRTFDKIYILNLHGNSIKQEKCPDGSKDENVFDIRVGVSIIFAIKTSKNNAWGKVYYQDLYGLREDKFTKLQKGEFEFKEVKLDSKTAVFVPQDNANKEEYDKGVSLVELFNIYSAGIVMGRDSLCAQNSKEDIEKVVLDFKTKDESDLRVKYSLGKDTDWKVGEAKKDIESGVGKLVEIAYRIFDHRWTYYSGKQNGFHCRSRSEVMCNFANDENNLGFCFTRTDKSQRPYSMVFVTDKITESCYLTTQTAGIATVCPLYIAPDDISKERTINYNVAPLKTLTQNLLQEVSEKDVFNYCYGVLYNPAYREKFNELLKLDYPKVSIPANQEEFDKFATAGKRLIELHLMKANVSKELDLELDETQNLSIEQVKYQDGKVYINKATAICGITEEVWNYFIGGYQIIDKWLKTHKGEVLDYDKFSHLKKIVAIVEETIKIQKTL